ncbi:MAG: ComF family protein [Minisyncoccia bacterium]
MCVTCGKSGTFLCEICFGNIGRAHQPSQPFITAIFDYQNPSIRKVIWQLKYKNARVVARYFGKALYEEILGELKSNTHISKDEIFLLVPVPLHKKRLRERGYNQSELLAREIIKYSEDQTSKKIFMLSPYALVRTRATKPQAKKENRATRFENLQGAFVASTKVTSGKHVILIDDVTTTGATLSEARKALLKAGAKTVRGCAVAH